ncbi:MAG: ribosome recycling factor [Pseudomonadales bacterium]|jgi:ribosome recycling factor|uniref:Ribosome-recycling factor n=1 Tax=OM182 bacterium TaxID=2510334 RepID=A0A520RWP3_9GAMM|nr:ribosome recycling factor [Gammaproteobacteria bacterium]MCH1601045.1 ribosome recycling factor [Pseudomonadales bacterium]RZO74662.1 MAG: ribosome recycling factor [OM182 bacterium]HAU23794.1 ribosome recycling factor [Gammaproteobacteria bacterium]HBJ89152.1 ribosome recycling factor [Gammaproteobacteria bacterium]|tara:strand:+ start:1361 stop:1918 length:558 start_codon:yes stop_codon:yes gene_type:complete
MIDEIIKDAEKRMTKSLASLDDAFKRIRTGRAHPSILDSVMVSYYGNDTPLNQLANVNVEEGRSLLISPWEKQIISDIEKAIMKSDLGLNPSNNGDTIRVPMPPLTEETRREYTKQAKNEAENARIAIRNIRRDANSDFKDLEKEKEISEDEQRRAEDLVQKLTDKYVAEVEAAYQVKEQDLLSF